MEPSRPSVIDAVVQHVGQWTAAVSHRSSPSADLLRLPVFPPPPPLPACLACLATALRLPCPCLSQPQGRERIRQVLRDIFGDVLVEDGKPEAEALGTPGAAGGFSSAGDETTTADHEVLANAMAAVRRRSLSRKPSLRKQDMEPQVKRCSCGPCLPSNDSCSKQWAVTRRPCCVCSRGA